MTLEQLDFFLMAVRCDTFLEAAENLHIAQSTLSKQIQKLETELNLPLFDRTGTRVVPVGLCRILDAPVSLAHAAFLPVCHRGRVAHDPP